MKVFHSLCPVAILAMLLVGCNDPRATGITPTRMPAATAPAATLSAPTAAAAAAPAPPLRTPTPAPGEVPPLTGDIVGWFTEPRPATSVERRTLAAPPASPFRPRADRSNDVVLYDVQTMTERVLGQGGFARFSPDGTMLAWVTGVEPPNWNELRVLDLRTGDERSLGRARALRWVDHRTIVVFEAGNDLALVDVATGAHSPAGDVNLNPVERPIEEAGYRLERTLVHEPYPFWRSTYRVTRLATGASFEFDAYRAVLSPDGTIFLATVSEVATRKRPTEGPDVGVMTSNIFALDPATKQARFIATAQPSFPNWPFDASATHVIWNDRACATDAATRLYDRRSKRLVELSRTLWPQFTPAGAIASGAFGARILIDAETLAYLTVLPGEFSPDVFWSPDYRYAVMSTVQGHGGLCG